MWLCMTCNCKQLCHSWSELCLHMYKSFPSHMYVSDPQEQQSMLWPSRSHGNFSPFQFTARTKSSNPSNKSAESNPSSQLVKFAFTFHKPLEPDPTVAVEGSSPTEKGWNKHINASMGQVYCLKTIRVITKWSDVVISTALKGWDASNVSACLKEQTLPVGLQWACLIISDYKLLSQCTSQLLP